MTKGDLENKRFLNRPIKPLAFIMMCLMFVIVYFNIVNDGLFYDLWLGDILALIAAVSSASLFFGWFYQIQSMAEAGLLMAGIVYVVGSFFILFLTGLNNENFWQYFLIGVLSLSAFLLEARDSTYQRRKRT